MDSFFVKIKKTEQIPVLSLILSGLQFFHFFHPYTVESVGRHPPVATRRQAKCTNLRAVRQAGAFELLHEETAIEVFQPFQQCFSVIAAVEGDFCQIQHFCRAEAETENMEQEEIVEFIRPNEVFCFLIDFAVFIRGQKFGADGGIQYIWNVLPSLPVPVPVFWVRRH